MLRKFSENKTMSKNMMGWRRLSYTSTTSAAALSSSLSYTSITSAAAWSSSLSSSCCGLPRKEAHHLGMKRSGVKMQSMTSASGEMKQDIKIPVKKITFQEAIFALQHYWTLKGCGIYLPHNTEVGAGTMNPATFLRALGPEPWNVAYPEPSVRPDDSRFGANPNRIQRHTQFQVILKPEPGNPQELLLGSLEALGIDTRLHDIRFVEDNWESPVLGAWGLGWEVWLDGMEVTQFTYFQQVGGVVADPVSVEITYGLERILMALQGVSHFKDIKYNGTLTYGELFMQNEYEMSCYNINEASIEDMRTRFELYFQEGMSLIEKKLPIPAYDHLLKASHAFNILDARGAVGVTERAKLFGQMRKLARDCTELWVQRRRELEFPLGVCSFGKPKNTEAVSGGKDLSEPRDFLLELGSEELPPDEVDSVIEQIKGKLPDLLSSLHLSHDDIVCSGTPRRIFALVPNLSHRQEDRIERVRGPPSKIAFNGMGEPTKAALGFCKKNGVEPEDIEMDVDDSGTVYCWVTKNVSGEAAHKLLSECLPTFIGGLNFKKSMRWNSKSTYSRPLRWIVAMHGSTVVPFMVSGVGSGDATYGLRSGSQVPSISIESAETYIEEVNKHNILVDLAERKAMIWERAQNLSKDVGGKIPGEMQGDLLSEVANLVEYPTAILGSFREDFLELPKEVLITVMKKHQRYFPVERDSSTDLLPYFVTTANGNIDLDTVRAGNEGVLTARFEDAVYFYKSDMSTKLEEFRPLLSGTMFQKDLGTMLDKSERTEKLVTPLASAMGLEDSVETAKVAAHLSRADLATALVTEFTTLAGIMGRHYALKNGLENEVAEAIYESVLPRHASDDVPGSPAGITVAICDRLDSLVGLVAAGCTPSASADPYGLRRVAYGMLQSLIQNNVHLNIVDAIHYCAKLQPIEVTDEHCAQAHEFLVKRLEQLMIEENAPKEVVRAVLNERNTDPSLAVHTIQELSKIYQTDSFAAMVAAYARPTRIVAGKDVDTAWTVDEALFETQEEKDLWASYKSTATIVSNTCSVAQLVDASECLIEPLGNFFNSVFVMAEEDNVRNNRLAMMRDITRLPKGILDLKSLPNF